MNLIAQLLTSFIASAAFGLIFDVPKHKLVHCGAVGMIGWLVYVIGIQLNVDTIPATLAASFLVTIISQLFSRLYRTPIIIFSAAGIIPLVPGGLAYDSMRHFVGDQYDTAMQLGVKALMISGAIAIGLIFSEVINQIIHKSVRRR